MIRPEAVSASQAAHSVWSTPGTLVELRLPKQATAAADVVEAPEGAVLLNNPDGSHTFFWVPDAADIGKHEVTIQLSDSGNTILQLDYQFQVDVLESGSLVPRLNPLPTLQLGDEPDKSATTGIHQLAAGQPYELLINVRDQGEKRPVLNIHGVASAALWQPESDSSYRLRWTPGVADIGYTNLTVYAVDGEQPLQYSSKHLNLQVHAKPNAENQMEWLDKRFDLQPMEPKSAAPVISSAPVEQEEQPARTVVTGSLP